MRFGKKLFFRPTMSGVDTDKDKVGSFSIDTV